ncbi:agmatinase [[Clostridium] asparagiforme DSM 15981]|uniref:Agmatinase n=2 Tax=Enterocloster asparagiformis TaxID=333367 RepID=C0CZP5_9FIRM|nr:agmatinase [[Clostridium] asparagiforme DSM 15981]
MKKEICTDLDRLEADVAVLGVPYDMGIQYRSGTNQGPECIRAGSKLTAFTNDDGVYDPDRDEMFLDSRWRIVDCGDADIVHGDLEQSFRNIEESVRKIVARGAIPVVMGGDHSITIPVVRALDSLGPVCVVQIDAHLDWCDERAGQKLGQGSPMRRLSEMKHVDGMAQVGIRGLGSSMKSDFEAARAYGSVIISARDVKKKGIDYALSQIPPAERYYITYDIDGTDPALVTGTGTPSAGGLDYYEINDLLYGITKKGEVVGFDLVEVAPQYDPSGYTGIFAARMMIEFMGYILKSKER